MDLQAGQLISPASTCPALLIASAPFKDSLQPQMSSSSELDVMMPQQKQALMLLLLPAQCEWPTVRLLSKPLPLGNSMRHLVCI